MSFAARTKVFMHFVDGQRPQMVTFWRTPMKIQSPSSSIRSTIQDSFGDMSGRVDGLSFGLSMGIAMEPLTKNVASVVDIEDSTFRTYRDQQYPYPVWQY